MHFTKDEYMHVIGTSTANFTSNLEYFDSHIIAKLSNSTVADALHRFLGFLTTFFAIVEIIMVCSKAINSGFGVFWTVALIIFAFAFGVSGSATSNNEFDNYDDAGKELSPQDKLNDYLYQKLDYLGLEWGSKHFMWDDYLHEQSVFESLIGFAFLMGKKKEMQEILTSYPQFEVVMKAMRRADSVHNQDSSMCDLEEAYHKMLDDMEDELYKLDEPFTKKMIVQMINNKDYGCLPNWVKEDAVNRFNDRVISDLKTQGLISK